MIYNPACAHCRQKLKQGLRNSYYEQSLLNKERRGSVTSSTSHSQQPWLNERVLRAFDEPPPPSQILPKQNICPPMGSFCSSPLPLTPDAGFEAMLQTLENAIQTHESGKAQSTNTMFQVPDSHSGHRDSVGSRLEPDIPSPTARAQHPLINGMEDLSLPQNWLTRPSAPSSSSMPYSSASAISNYSMSPPASLPPLSAPSFSNSNASMRSSIDSCYNSPPPLHDPLFDMLDDHLPESFLSGQSPPFPIPKPHQDHHTRRNHHTTSRPNRTFEFVLENPVEDQRHCRQRKV